MSLIRVVVEDLRCAAARYTVAAERLNQLIRALGDATSLAAGAEGDFQEQVRTVEAKAVPLAQRLLSDVGNAHDYLVARADAFEQADHAFEAGLDQLAREIKAAADLGLSFTLVPSWLWSGGPPPGHKPGYWDRLGLEDKMAIQEDIQRRLRRWLEQLTAEGRLATATIEEFEDMLRGVRKVWAWTDLNVRVSAGADAAQIGSLSTYQVAEWTGQVLMVAGSPWYEVMYQDDKKGMVRGWVSGKYVAGYAYVNPEVVGAQSIDLSVPDEVVRPPQDAELAAAVRRGPHYAPQYMDIKPPVLDAQGNIIGHQAPRPHDNLCGQIAAAGVLGEDVKDILDRWESDPSTKATAAAILNDPSRGTLRSELTAIFEISGHETTDHDGFLSPLDFHRELETGRRFVAGTGLNTGTGEIAPGGAGHWIIVEEVIPVGNGGWVRILQSHINHPAGYVVDTSHPVMLEQVVPWEQFQEAWREFGPNNSTFHGFWVEPSASPNQPLFPTGNE